MLFDACILPSRVVDPNKKVSDLNHEVQDTLLEEVDLDFDLRSGGISPQINPRIPFGLTTAEKDEAIIIVSI